MGNACKAPRRGTWSWALGLSALVFPAVTGATQDTSLVDSVARAIEDPSCFVSEVRIVDEKQYKGALRTVIWDVAVAHKRITVLTRGRQPSRMWFVAGAALYECHDDERRIRSGRAYVVVGRREAGSPPRLTGWWRSRSVSRSERRELKGRIGRRRAASEALRAQPPALWNSWGVLASHGNTHAPIKSWLGKQGKLPRDARVVVFLPEGIDVEASFECESEGAIVFGATVLSEKSDEQRPGLLLELSRRQHRIMDSRRLYAGVVAGKGTDESGAVHVVLAHLPVIGLRSPGVSALRSWLATRRMGR